MKISKLLAVTFLSSIVLYSCQKELSLDGGGVAAGTLKSDVTGDCMPSVVNGIFKADSVLSNNNYIDVQVNVTNSGAYTIKSDTINGYSFKGTGAFGVLGLNTVRLYATGKPIAAGINTFNIIFGSSICQVDITVLGTGTNIAVYTLGGAPGTCSGVSLAGVYKVGVALNATNTVTLNVNVTGLGAYAFGAASTNGMLFTTTGNFTVTGVQSVTLSAVGSPLAAGAFNVTASNGTSTCIFSITVLPAGGTAAVYTLGGAGSTCTGVVLAGTYQAGLAMTATNTAKIDVNVTTIGTYTISTLAVNGVTFTKTGSFAATGAQTVTLVATGTPVAAGANTFAVTGNASTCSFQVTFAVAAPPAVYTLTGAPGACTTPAIAGTYAAGTALNATNTVTVNVNVTTAGSYTLTTNTINGMIFSKTGVFATTGPQTVVLVGSGTPVASGSHILTPQIGTSSCTFTIVVTGALPVNLDYIPETVGSNWSYKLQGGFPSDTFYLKVSPATIVKSAQTYRIFEYIDAGTVTDSSLHRKSGSSYFEYLATDLGYFDNPVNKEVLLLDSNAAVNATWSNNLGANTIGGTPVTSKLNGIILAKGATATINSISYSNIIKVKYTFIINIGFGDTPVAENEVWYAKGKGEIYSKTNDVPPAQIDIYEATRIQIL